MTADCKILNPNGTTFNSWTYTSVGHAKTSIRGFSKLLPTTPGLYTFQASYNGTTCSKNFNISQVVSTSTIPSKDPYLILYNLANKTITISSQNVEEDHYEISLVSIAGNIVFKTAGIIEVHSNQKVIQTADLPNGIYFLSIHSTKNRYTKKVFIGNP
jgi:hypothetical protein